MAARLRLRGQRAARARGFTLIEMLIAVMLFGLLSLMLSPTFRTFMTARDQAYKERQTFVNNKIAQAMQEFAEQPPPATPIGVLPAPWTNTSGRFFLAPVNMTTGSTTSVMPYAQAQGLTTSEFNDDGSAAARVRVYQRAQGIPVDSYLFFQGGPPVSLNYDLGVVYMTACARAQTCNASATTPTTQTTPTPTRLTAANYASWTPPSDAVGTVFFSTLPLQKRMLALTASRLDRIREAMTNFYNAKGNYPFPTAGRQLTNGAPALNQGCREGWYELGTDTVGSVVNDIAAQVGIGQKEDTRTAWGASIEYCQDYDATGAKGLDTAPRYAALRINRYVSQAMSPDPTNPLMNVVVSF